MEKRVVIIELDKERGLMTKKIRVLIADDDPTILENYSLILELDRSQSYLVETVRQVNDVMGAIKRFRPDVVLLDNHFDDNEAGIDDLLPRISALYPEISVVIITAKRGSDSDPILRAMGWSAEGFLDKPVGKDVLRSKVLEVYERKQKEKIQ